MTEQPQTTRREFIHKAGVLIGAGIMVNPLSGYSFTEKKDLDSGRNH